MCLLQNLKCQQKVGCYDCLLKKYFSSDFKKKTLACWDSIDAHCHNDKEIERSRPDLTEFVADVGSLLFGFFQVDDTVR